MSNLVLDSLEIKNFRAFKHLKIEKLGRVNLIVGKNNVGKSSVLEALWLYITHGEPSVINQILSGREEMVPLQDRDARRAIVESQERATALNSLFYGRINARHNHDPISIGPIDSLEHRLLIDIAWLNINFSQNKYPHISVADGTKAVLAFRIDQDNHSEFFALPPAIVSDQYTFILAEGLNPAETGFLWDLIALTDAEQDVIAALKIIAPEVEAINLVGNEGKNGERTAKVRSPGITTPIPLRSMGEGMNRMFGIILALVNAKDGMLLIDEVDTGLHYSVLPDVWKLIFEVAHRLNVQVFATSHSWDCIQAFQQAADENKDEEGVLIRLENRKDGVGAVTFDERDLAIVTREQIEVR